MPKNPRPKPNPLVESIDSLPHTTQELQGEVVIYSSEFDVGFLNCGGRRVGFTAKSLIGIRKEDLRVGDRLSAQVDRYNFAVQVKIPVA